MLKNLAITLPIPRLIPFLLVLAGLGLGAFALWGLDLGSGLIANSGGMIPFLLVLAALALVAVGVTLWLRNDDRRRRRYRRRR